MGEHNIPFRFTITREERNRANGHHSLFVLFTGLSGSGKSTLANALEEKLHQEQYKTYVLDGDNIRKGINNDLTFSPSDRSENIRRIAGIAEIMLDAGLVVLAAFVSPYKKDREYIEYTIKPHNFVEVFVKTTLRECKHRDTKGLYEKALSGEINNLTGVGAPYEAPQHPDVEITEQDSLEEAIDKIYRVVIKKLQLEEE